MPSKEFNKDLDIYIKGRRKRKAYIPAEKKPMEEPVVIEQSVEESQPTEEKKGFFQKIKNFFQAEEESTDPKIEVQDDPPVDPHADCRDDVKRLGKITLETVKMLPQKDLLAFKNSSDYQALRDILGKYKLIKPPVQ